MSSLSNFNRIPFEGWKSPNITSGIDTFFIDIDYTKKINISLLNGSGLSGLPNDPIIRIFNFPRYNGFDNKVLTYTVAIKQGTTPISISQVQIAAEPGFLTRAPLPISWSGGIKPAGNADKLDFFNFIIINTGKGGTTTNGSDYNGYECFANLNGNYSYQV
jgi:hypothetical protein